MWKVSIKHEADNFAIAVLAFTWLVIDGFMEEKGLAPLSQKGN